MKRILLLSLLAFCPEIAQGQDSINPYSIHQSCNIILQNTDVYYNPFAPPASTDTREQLSCIASELRDPDGKREEYAYDPMTHGVHLSAWAPHGMAIGPYAMWQRLFTAARKADGSPSDIIVGSHVTNDTAKTHGYGEDTISKNEDVDFRASGTIKMENGFHVTPGAFFHAYIELKWNTTVFSDEFNHSSLTQWHAANGHGNLAAGANCAFDTDVHPTVRDTDAEDSAALQLDMRFDSCTCNQYLFYRGVFDTCNEHVDLTKLPVPFKFATAAITSCPWPYNKDSIRADPAYQHMPYGRWEVREKVPHTLQHTNNWGNSQGNEWNLDETELDGNFALIRPYLSHPYLYGPCKGKFSSDTGGTKFRSRSAHFTSWNYPRLISIDGFPYEVTLTTLSTDTFLQAVSPPSTTGIEGGFPSSVSSLSDSVTFYYTRWGNNTSDISSWTVTQDGSGQWDIFSGRYGPNARDTFSKSYQPTSMTFVVGFLHATFSAHWDHTTGKVKLSPPLDTAPPHSGVGIINYVVDEGPGYPIPSFAMDTNAYKYHKYSMEFLPHECRFLVDGAVVVRFPDRLVAPGDIRYDYVSMYPRSPLPINLAQFEIDYDGHDPFGLDSTEYSGEGSITYRERKYFQTHIGNLGFWNNAAHHLVDYIKIWDVPVDVKIPNFPQ